MTWFLRAIRKYAVFSGRARRKEYWMYILWANLIFLATYLPDFLGMVFGLVHSLSVLLQGVLFISLIIPTISVGVRRLHDIDKSGWWYLMSLIPIIGWIALLILFVQDSFPGANRYGPNPKA